MEDQETRLSLERTQKFKGTARIRLEFLKFGEPTFRELDPQIVKNLKAEFQKARGCQPLDRQHHIPALIDKEDLERAIHCANVGEEQLKSTIPSDWPILVFPKEYRLSCLHGQHRVKAGLEVLALRERWWAIDLYATGQ